MTLYGFAGANKPDAGPIPLETRLELQNEQLFRQRKQLLSMKDQFQRQHRRYLRDLRYLEELLLQNPQSPLLAVVEVRKMIQDLQVPGRKRD